MTDTRELEVGEEKPLRESILELLAGASPLKASEIARRLGHDRRNVNRCLSFELLGRVEQGSDYRWRAANLQSPAEQKDARPVTEFERLCRYYLECISQDMDQGVSVFARNQYGAPDYAELPAVPIETSYDWWNSDGVGALLGKVRGDRGKTMLWLGYPVRLRHHTTPRWNGFFAEPLLLWPVSLPDPQSAIPTIDSYAPVVNTKFIRSVTMGDGMQLAEESARLSDELGLSVPGPELPTIDEVVERLVRIRPDLDWRESMDPSVCDRSTPLSELQTAGIYNRAVILPGERSPFTVGLESELKALSQTAPLIINTSILGHWFKGEIPPLAQTTADSEPLLEVLPMNTEQRSAVRAALSMPHTVITGPPGTGKSQVVTNMLVNAAWRNMKVLFASKNNKAVDVVEARVNGLGNRPVLLRLGSREYQSKLGMYLSQVIAGNPGPEVQHNYDEALERHRALAARSQELDRTMYETMERRNAVDQLDSAADSGRQIFGSGFLSIDGSVIERAAADLADVTRAVERVDRGTQGFFVRILWPMFKAARRQQLADALKGADSTFNALAIDWRAWNETEGIEQLRLQLREFTSRVGLAEEVVRYRDALSALQHSTSLEAIAQLRSQLAEQVGSNSSQLWREWVQLAPKRLTRAQRKDISDYAAALQLATGTDAERIHASVKQKIRSLQSNVTALFSSWGITSLSARGRVPLEAGYFDLVVIDEASQCDIASALPLLFRAKRSVIIGDPMQLRHVSSLTQARDSELQFKHELVDNRLGWMYSVNSLFDLAASVVPSDSILNLRDHHRSHADIIGFSNEAFYEGRLRVATRHQHLKRPNATQPGIVWQNVSGEVSRPRDGGAQNAREASALVSALVDLLVKNGYTGTVGVVTPFRAQAQLLQTLINSTTELEAVAARAELLVDTVHKFQGDERDVIFFSPVVSNGISGGSLGFLRGNGNLFNVAISRARGLLHVVGDMSVSACCGVDYLESFVRYVSSLEGSKAASTGAEVHPSGPSYPKVAHPERVSEWEHVLYRAMVADGLAPIPQFSVEQYDLDFALINADRKLAIEVDGERYHRSWTGDLCLRDQLRNQRLIELGWDVQRFWVYEVRDDLEGCVRKLQSWVANER